ncbi:DUF3886 domain-containing protein [Salimicrobium halophilum]|uniref:DUF3886 domain-containing protein n=1 Tax=Salimicrobium halophilum TaxID=86666 RepID=A0A1G8PWS5_9BACI|nr:DUF3886 domain-containing protein [Salimicrobium halophilum]SDI96931.1 Protein of unknown function [Salimicrobium halophilum]
MKDQKPSLKDQMDEDLVKQLQNKKKQWKQQELEAEERERKRRLEEKRKSEANKSFEELLEESEMDWKKYK